MRRRERSLKAVNANTFARIASAPESLSHSAVDCGRDTADVLTPTTGDIDSQIHRVGRSAQIKLTCPVRLRQR